MKNVDLELKTIIKQALQEVEETGDIVFVSPVLEGAAKIIADKTKEAYVGEIFSHEELVFFRQLVQRQPTMISCSAVS